MSGEIIYGIISGVIPWSKGRNSVLISVHFRNIFGAISLSGRSWSGSERTVGERKVLFL